MKAKDQWEEFIVEVENPLLKITIPVCGLCANCGEIDTTQSARIFNKEVGIKTYCICPNGRAMKKYYDSLPKVS